MVVVVKIQDRHMPNPDVIYVYPVISNIMSRIHPSGRLNQSHQFALIRLEQVPSDAQTSTTYQGPRSSRLLIWRAWWTCRQGLQQIIGAPVLLLPRFVGYHSHPYVYFLRHVATNCGPLTSLALVCCLHINSQTCIVLYL